MAERYDVCVPRPKRDGGTFWVKVGTGFPSKDKDSLQIVLDALPLPDSEGRCSVTLFPSKPKQQQRQAGFGDDPF